MFLPAENLCGTLRPLREKGAAGFGDSEQCRGKSRMEPRRSAALSICASSFGGSMGGPRGPAGFREVARFANPSSHRLCLATGGVVVANRNLWRPFMATSRKGAAAPTRRTRTAKSSAVIIPFEQAGLRRTSPAQPKSPDPLDILETALEVYASALRNLIADIRKQGDAQ